MRKLGLATSVLLLLSSGGNFLTASVGVEASCSSPNATGSVFTNTIGGGSSLVLSDADGNGTAAHYGISEACDWTLSCPSGGTVVLVLSGSMSGESDQVLQVGTDRSFTGSLNHLEVLTQSPSVNVSFTTGTSTQSPNFGLPAGWSAEWTCAATTCASPNTTGTVYAAQSGTLYSDADGYGNSHDYALGQSCSFSIECPSGLGAQYISLSSLVDIQSSHVLQIKDATTGSLIETMSSTPSSGQAPAQLLPWTNITLFWDASSTAARRSSAGWTITYACVTSHCSATSVPSGSLLAPTAQAATIMSDADGYGSASLYANGESCEWDIVCPVGYQYVRVDASTSLRTGMDTLALTKPSNNDETVLDFASQASGSNNLIEIAAAGAAQATTLQLSFRTSEFDIGTQTSASTGFTATVQCVRDRCSSPNASVPITDKLSGRILSDLDGVGNQSLITETEECGWSIKCPLDHHFAITRFLSNITYAKYLQIQYVNGTAYSADKAFLNITDDRPNQHFYYGGRSHPSSVTKPQSAVYAGWSEVNIQFINSKVTRTVRKRTYNSTSGYYFTTYEKIARVGGYTLDWACLPSPCLADVTDGATVPASQNMIELGGTTTDGYATLGTRCHWTFASCSDGRRPILNEFGSASRYSISWISSNVLYVNAENPGAAASPYPTTSILFQCRPAGVYDARDMCWSSNISASNGPLATTLAAGETAWIYSSPDIHQALLGNFDVLQQSCTWRFSCSDAGNVLLFSITGKTQSSGSNLFKLLLEDLDGNLIRPLYSGTFTSNARSSEPLAHPPGSGLQIRASREYSNLIINATCVAAQDACYVTNGTVIQPPASGAFTSIYSDADGANSNTLTPAGLSCQYIVKCPTGKSITLYVKGRIYSGDFVTVGFQVVRGDQHLFSPRLRNFTIAESQVVVGWSHGLTYRSTHRTGLEIHARCSTKVTTSLPKNNGEICPISTRNEFSISQRADRIRFHLPYRYGSRYHEKAYESSDSIGDGCVVTVDCNGVSDAHTMVIAYTGNGQTKYTHSPFSRVYDGNSGKVIYNTSTKYYYTRYDSTNSSYHATYTSESGEPTNLFVLSASDKNKAVIQLRRAGGNYVDFSVFCLSDPSMVPSANTRWRTKTLKQSTSSNSSSGSSDSSIESFYSYPVNPYNQKNPGSNQFYRNHIDEFTIYQCVSNGGSNFATETRVSIAAVRGNNKRGAPSDRLVFLDGEEGSGAVLQQTKYRQFWGTGVTAYAVLAHFRSGDNGAVDTDAVYGYQYDVHCGPYKYGANVSSYNKYGCARDEYEYYRKCYPNGAQAGLSSSWLMALALTCMLAAVI